VCNVKGFVLELAHEDGGEKDNEHGKSSYNSNHFIFLLELVQAPGLVVCLDINYPMDKRVDDCAITSYLMENVETLIGVGSQESKGGVLKCEESDECNIENCDPRMDVRNRLQENGN